MASTRGIRNNNPGNIDWSRANNWVGQVGIESTGNPPRFAVFDRPENGIRALCKLLQTYRNKYGLKTVAAIIGRWAPGNENDTGAYVRSVESRIPGHKPGGEVDLRNAATLRAFVVAIIAHENANYHYPEEVLAEGLRRGLS